MTTIKLDAHTLSLQHDASAITNKMAQATMRTLQILFLGGGSTPVNYNPPIFLPESQLITPSDAEVAPPDVTDYLGKLVCAAQHVAESHCYGSFVAGQASESDECADVALWLGKGNYGRNHEKEILIKLGLVSWTEEAEVSVGQDILSLLMIVGRLRADRAGGRTL